MKFTRQKITVDLSNRTLHEIPAHILIDSSIEVLILDNNYIVEIPDEIGNLENLSELSLNGNPIQKISKEISTLSKLVTISLANISIRDIPEEIYAIKSLKNLYLYNNEISKIDKRIKNLEALEILIISNNNLFELPLELEQLRELQELDVSRNQIFKIDSSVLNLSELELLDLSYNQISEFPHLVNELPALVNLSLRGNPLELPPPELSFEKYNDDSNIGKIRQYFREYFGAKSDFLFEIKLLLVGEGRVGKTSVSKKLSIPKYFLKDEETTYGIEIKPWIISKKEFTRKTKNSHFKPKKNLRVNIWDFGGQEIYHATHQFFLTKRSLYILVTESRQEDKYEDFYYWLNCIKVFGDNSPVIIVQNKCDQPIKDLPLKEFKSSFPNIQVLQRVSCMNNLGISDLKNIIKELVIDPNIFPHIGSQLPKVWVDVRNEIEKIQDKGVDYIDYQSYLKICLKYEMNEERANFLVDFFNDIGVLLYFRDDWDLKDTVFLNHAWVTNSVYKVLDNKEIISKHGKFTTRDLEKVWKVKRYYNKRRELLSLMKKFELCFEISSNTYLVPQLLEVDEVSYTWDESKDNIRIYYQYKFMPKGILTRLIVKRHNDILNSKYWRHGVILEYAETQALIKEKFFDRQITIDLQGKNKKLLLESIKKSIKEIHADFHNIEFEEMVPCICGECRHSTNPHYFKSSELYLRKNRNKETIECYNSFENIRIEEILSKTELKSDFSENATKDNSIFISYAHADKEWLNKVIKHLTVLKKEGYHLEIWSDEKIGVSQNWRNEIYDALHKAKIGILLISTDFLSSDFIMDNELPMLLANAMNNGTHIMPIVLKPSRFNKHKIISSFQAVNDPSKPLSALSEAEQDNILVNLADSVEDIILGKL